MKNKKILIVSVVLLVIVGLVAGGYFTLRSPWKYRGDEAIKVLWVNSYNIERSGARLDGFLDALGDDSKVETKVFEMRIACYLRFFFLSLISFSSLSISASEMSSFSTRNCIIGDIAPSKARLIVRVISLLRACFWVTAERYRFRLRIFSTLSSSFLTMRSIMVLTVV